VAIWRGGELCEVIAQDLCQPRMGRHDPCVAFCAVLELSALALTALIGPVAARLRKVTRNRGQFPSEQAALKVLHLAVRNLQDYRSPNTGIRSSGWKQALQAFTIYFDGRIPAT